MDNSFFAYLQRLEIMAFFSGYALLCALVVGIAKVFFNENNAKRVLSFLPISYAFCGILFLGLQVRHLYPEFSWEQLRENLYQPFLVVWGLCSIFFLLPVLRRQFFLSVLHSLVFFFFVAKDLYQLTFISANKEIVRNDMKVLTDSLVLNLGTLVLVAIIYAIRQVVRNTRLRHERNALM